MEITRLILFNLVIGVQGGMIFAHDGADSLIERPVNLLLLVVLVSMLPVFLMMTSFVKISVVLAILRNAVGSYHIPSNQVILGLSLLLTVYTMFPVVLEIDKAAHEALPNYSNNVSIMSNATISELLIAAKAAKAPMCKFLAKHAGKKEQQLFHLLMKKINKANYDVKISKDDMIVLMPAFVISELKKAFEIGFVIFIPFLIIDLIISNILLSLGMFMVSPTTISLPFKLLLFVLADGWFLIVKGLVESYMR